MSEQRIDSQLSEGGAIASPAPELDVREVPKPQRHPLIFARFHGLAVGESFILVNGHDPKHLREEFEREHPGTFGWEYLTSGERVQDESSVRLWRILITRLVAADLPRKLGDVATLLAPQGAGSPAEVDGGGVDGPGVGGAVWTLQPAARQLDANVIHLGPLGTIQRHTGPDLDVLLHIVDGSGEIATARGTVGLAPGDLVWLPRRSERAIIAGEDGLSYLSVHTRRPALTVGPAPH